MKVIFILLGSLALLLGMIGVVLPGLPTTPFLLLSAALYLKGSRKLYDKLINNKLLGKYIKNFQKHKSISLEHKIAAQIMMWTMIAISSIFVVKSMVYTIVIVIVGLIGTIVMCFIIPTLKPETHQALEQDDTDL